MESLYDVDGRITRRQHVDPGANPGVVLARTWSRRVEANGTRISSRE